MVMTGIKEGLKQCTQKNSIEEYKMIQSYSIFIISTIFISNLKLFSSAPSHGTVVNYWLRMVNF